MEDTTDRHLVKPIGRNKGEVDARPLESVKAALSLFGESVSEPADGRKLKISCAEKNMAKDRDVFLVQNVLNMSVEQLEDSEDTEVQHELEMDKAKVVLEAFTSKLEEAKKSKEKAKKVASLVKKLEAANPHFIEAYNKVLKEELSAAREQHMMATAELENVREELKKTEEYVSTYKKAEGLALKQVDKATMAAEKIDMMLDKLVKEIAATNESLALLKLDCIEAEKEKAVLLAAKDAETQKLAEMAEQNRKQLEALGRDVDAAKDLETKLKTSTSTIEKLQQDLHLAKESEYILAKVVADATQSINDLKLKSKQAESDAAISLTSISAELEEAKGNLKKTTEECNSLRNSEEFLREELEQIRKERHESREREAEFEVSIALLNAELHKSRSLSAMAAAAEAKAKVAALELSVALKQLATEAERAKEEAKAMKEEARQANLEAEHTMANLTAAEARLQDVLKEAKEMEDMAQVMKEESRKEKLNTEKIMAGMTSLEVRLQDAIKVVERIAEEGQAMKEEARKAKLEAEQAKAEMTSLELKLKDALMEGEATKEELQAIKEEAGKANSEAEKAKADKATLVAELQDTLEVAKTEKEAAQSMQEEARKAKLETEQAKAEMTSLELRLKDAIMEGKATKEEVQAMKEQADKANSEAVKAKAEKATLEVELQDAVKVAETEKEAAQAMREEAKKAKLETEQSKADISSVEARLQDAIKDSKAARIAEAAALSKLKSLYEEKDERMNAHKFFTGITISPDEYSRMMRKMNESNIKAAEIREGAKEGEEELLSKLEMANKEIEGLKLASERASMRADKAEIGRRAIENELRKWRKKAYEAGYGTLNEQAVQNNDISPKPPVAVIKPLNAEPLSKFLNIKIQSSDELQSFHSNTNAITNANANANANANDVTERKRNRLIANFIKKKT